MLVIDFIHQCLVLSFFSFFLSFFLLFSLVSFPSKTSCMPDQVRSASIQSATDRTSLTFYFIFMSQGVHYNMKGNNSVPW